MPKLKSKSSAKKRFSVTGTGKVRRRSANHRHNLTKQAKKVKRNHRRSKVMAPQDAAIVKRYLPYL